MSVLKQYYREFIETKPDPDVESWPFVLSFKAMAMTIVAYLFVVLWAAPKYMKNKKPYNLKTVLLIYNAFMIIYSIHINLVFYKTEHCLKLLFVPNRVYYNVQRETQLRFCWVSYLYYVGKFLELTETLFFVLRKKFKQVSFLHVFHHSNMILASWTTLKYSPGTHIESFILNNNIHVIMYTYYFLAALGPQFQKYLWWKKYVTTLQVIQFYSIIIVLIVGLFIDDYGHRMMSLIFITNLSLFIVLFTKYYKATYKQNNTKNLTK